MHDMELEPQRNGSRLHTPHKGLSNCGTRWVDEHSNDGD
jgi:hypothetical protein